MKSIGSFTIPFWIFMQSILIYINFQHYKTYFSCNEDFMYNVIKKVISAKDINHRGQGLWVSLKVLPGDIKQVSHFVVLMSNIPYVFSIVILYIKINFGL